MKTYLSYIYLSFIFFACNYSETGEDSIELLERFYTSDDRKRATGINVELPSLDSKEEIHYESYIADVNFILLEETEQSKINNADDVRFANDKYYLINRKEATIVVFNQDGSFHAKLNNVGRGPGEHANRFSAVSIDCETGDIYLTNLNDFSILHYSQDCRYIKSFKFPFTSSKFEYIGDNQFICYKELYPFVDPERNFKQVNYDYIVYDIEKEKIIETDLPYPTTTNISVFSGGKMGPTNPCDGSPILFREDYNTRVYQVNKQKKLEPYYYFNFGFTNTKEEIRKLLINEKEVSYDDKCKMKNIHTLQHFSESDNYVLFSVHTTKDQRNKGACWFYYGIHDKKTNNTTMAPRFTEPFYLESIVPSSTFNNTHLAVVSSDYIYSEYERLKTIFNESQKLSDQEFDEKLKAKDPTFYNLHESLGKNRFNCIIAEYKFK